jgi:hypothetical protein
MDIIMYYLISLWNIATQLFPLTAFFLILAVSLTLWFRWLRKFPTPDPVFSPSVKVKYYPFWTVVLK